jgi:hypothetical protein
MPFPPPELVTSSPNHTGLTDYQKGPMLQKERFRPAVKFRDIEKDFLQAKIIHQLLDNTDNESDSDDLDNDSELGDNLGTSTSAEDDVFVLSYTREADADINLSSVTS